MHRCPSRYDSLLLALVLAIYDSNLRPMNPERNPAAHRAGFIPLHTRLTDETKGLIRDETLAQCKAGLRIINCVRGGIVDEQAWLRGLQPGKVAGAALDVFEQEPVGDHPLFKHPRVIAMPHLGASTEEAQEKMARQIALQIADMI